MKEISQNLRFLESERSFGGWVDKSDLIGKIAVADDTIVFTRPNGFGKTMLLSAFESLFSRGIEDFRGLKIDGAWHDRTYKVIRLELAGMVHAGCGASDACEMFTDAFKQRILDAMPIAKVGAVRAEEVERLEVADILRRCLRQCDAKSLVLLVDDCDAPETEASEYPEIQPWVRAEMSSFFETVKDFESVFRFTFMTGVSARAAANLFGGFNSFTDQSSAEKYNELLGFTEKELHLYFDGLIQDAALALQTTAEDVNVRLKSRCGGHRFSPAAKETLYNPGAVLQFLRSQSRREVTDL